MFHKLINLFSFFIFLRYFDFGIIEYFALLSTYLYLC